jgi:methylmalonyl-CoA mutase
LWAEIVAAYKPECQKDCPDKKPDGLCRCACKTAVHAQTSRWNQTIYDAHINLLRTQTEAMSAAIAGVDSIAVEPFDITYRTPDDFSERIARNQQLLLKEECHFDKVVDPSAGSYYIEVLTNSMANAAWNLFLEVEEKGGFGAVTKSGAVQNAVNASSAARKKAIATRREIVVGTNQFPDFAEEASSKINMKEDCRRRCGNNATITSLDFSRGASEFETLRLATEMSGKAPKVFMLPIGDLAMRLARSQFSCNFFACAGYRIIDNLGFDTVETGIEAAIKADAQIVVLCSSDDEYAGFAPSAYKALNGRALFVVAGAPACMDDLKAQGIEHFISMKSNVLETLRKFKDDCVNEK